MQHLQISFTITITIKLNNNSPTIETDKLTFEPIHLLDYCVVKVI